jgi:DNA modification methylase
MDFYKNLLVDVEFLIPYVLNSRTHSDSQVAQIAASIREFGFTNPVLIDEKNNLIAGHGRVMAARKIGLTQVPAVVVTGMDDRRRRALIIADNKLALNAGWDEDALKVELEDLADDFGELMGFSNEELDAILCGDVVDGLTDEDEVPDAPAEPITKLGDVWILGNHRLMCGDSTSIDAVDKLMDGQKADLLHTDPPYNVDYSNQDRPKAGKIDLGRIKNDTMSSSDFYKFIYDMAVCAYSVLKDGSSAYVWHADRETINFKQGMLDAGFDFAQTIIWKKPMLLSRTRYQWAHEPCLFMVKGSPYFTDDRKKTTVWDFGGYDKSKNVHPTQKPIFIPEEAISNSSKQGSNVLDLFGGSGSTLIACEKTGRKSFLMELDPKYCDVIVKRWENFTGKKAINSDTGKTLDEMAQ